MANVFSGVGELSVAQSLYETAILQECAVMRREGVYVCLANLQSRMPKFNPEVLSAAFWSLARTGHF
jgi:hypothetical protein